MNNDLKIVIPIEIDKLKSDNNIKAYLKGIQNNVELMLTIDATSQQQSRIIQQTNDVIDNIAANMKSIKPQIDFEQFNLSIDSANDKLKAIKYSLEDFKDSANKNDFQIFKDMSSQGIFDNIKDSIKKFKESPIEVISPFKNAQGLIDKYNTLIAGGNLTSKTFKKGFEKILKKSDDGLSDYFKSIKGNKADFDAYNKSIGNTSQALAALTIKQTALNAATSMGIGLLVDFAVSGVMKLVQAHQEAIEKSKKITSEFKNFRSEIRDNISTLEGLDSEYSRLSYGIDENGKNIGLSSNEYRQYKEIVQQIAEISPSLIVGYDDEGNAIITRNDAVKEAIKLQKELQQANTAEYLSQGKDILKGTRNEIQDIQAEVDKAYNIITSVLSDDAFSGSKKSDFMTGIVGDAWGSPEYKDAIIQNYDQIIAEAKKQKTLSQEEINILNEQIGLIKSKNQEIKNSTDDVTNYLKVFSSSDINIDWFGNISSEYLDEFNKGLELISSDGTMSMNDMKVAAQQLGKSFIDIQDEIPLNEINVLKTNFDKGIISAKEFDDQLNVHRKTIYKLADNVDNQGLVQLAELLRLIANNYDDLGKVVNTDNVFKTLKNDIGNLIMSAENELKTTTSNFNILSSVFETLSNKEQVSLENILELIDLYPDYKSQLININENRENGIALINSLSQFEKDRYINSLKNDKTEIENKIKLIEKKRELIRLEQVSLTQTMSSRLIEAKDSKFTDQINTYEEDLDYIDELIKKAEDSSVSVTVPKITSGSDVWKKEFETLYADLQYIRDKDLINSQQYFEELNSLNNKYFANQDKYLDEYQKYELELYKLQKDISNEHIADIEHEILKLEQADNTEQQRINLYKNIQAELHKQAEHARSLGLSHNHDYIQELQKQWLSYADKVKSTEEELAKKVKEAKENALKDEIDILDKRKSLYESVVNAVTATIDKEVKSIEDSKDAFVKSIDEKIDKLNEEKNSLSKLQKEYETVFSIVNNTVNKQIEKLKGQRDEEEKSWNDKINALKEQNDEIEKQIELEKVQEALERALNQKNTLIYREGIGFEYESNFGEVNKAKESLDNLNRKLKLEEETKALEELRDNALEIIDTQIKGWEEYGQKWSDVVDNYQRDQNLLIAQQILGKNWESDILHQRTDRLGEFANEYTDISNKLETEIDKQIADLEREKETQIEVYDAKIEKLNEYKEKWTEIVDNYTLEQDRLKAAQILGADWEKEILDSRLSTFKTFRDEYINIIEELARKQESLNNLQNVKVDESGQIQNPQGGSNNLSDDYWKSYNAKATLPDGTIIGVNIDGSGKTTTTGLPPGTIIHTGGGDFKITGGTGGKYDGIPAGSEKNVDKAKEILKDTANKIRDTVGKIFGFANGTTFAPGGLSVVDELGQEMIVRNPFQGHYTYLENGDGVIPHNITETLMKLGSNPIDYLKQSIGDIRIPKIVNNQPIQEIIDIGDIKVYGVQNVDGLANAIITELPNMMLQKLYKK